MDYKEKINFPKVLRSVIGSELKQYGFKVNGTKLLREKEGMTDEIYFMRSQYNVQGNPQRFYLELTVKPHSFICYTGIRLINPNKLAVPKYFKEYLSIPGYDQTNLYENFSQEQKDEIFMLYESMHWIYSNEEELIKLLGIAKELLLTKGFKYFDTVRNMINNMSDIEEHRKMILQLEEELNDNYNHFGISKINQ